MTTFTGFSEEDLQRMKTPENRPKIDPLNNLQNIRKIDKIGLRPKKTLTQISLALDSDDGYKNTFDKCKLTLKTPTPISETGDTNVEIENVPSEEILPEGKEASRVCNNVTPDVIRCSDNYTEDEIKLHKAKLDELQMKQKLMEEQNKKRKEMLSKLLADRTKQTEDEVMKLEKIKKELEILDSQLSKDVATLRKQIDQACVNFSEAEKQYLKVEREFLQAKITLQKEKEKKELLIEHLCTLITCNETRKAQKLETMMLELAGGRNDISCDIPCIDDKPSTIIDGVDENGKMVENFPAS